MAWTLLAAGFCFYLPVDNSARVPLIAFFIFLFAGKYFILLMNLRYFIKIASLLLSWRRTSAVYIFCRSFPANSSRNGDVRSSKSRIYSRKKSHSRVMYSRSWAVATCLFWASVLSVTFPRMLAVFGSVGCLFQTSYNQLTANMP